MLFRLLQNLINLSTCVKHIRNSANLRPSYISGAANRGVGKKNISISRSKIDIATSYRDREHEIPTKAGNLARSPVIRRRKFGNADPSASAREKVRGDAKSRFAVGSTAANSSSARRTKARRLHVTFAPISEDGTAGGRGVAGTRG